LTKRGYEKEGVKELQKEIKDTNLIEPPSPKSPEVTTAIDGSGHSWQKNNQRERKDSTKNKKLLAAIKCNEIVKNEPVKQEPMIDLKNLKVSDSFDDNDSTPRNAFTLADFGFTSSKKKSLSFSESTPPPPAPKQQEAVKMGWNMNNVELKPTNSEHSDPFKELPSTTSSSKSSKSPKTPKSEKKFSSIIKDERKEKENFEKIRSKSLILTQVEERAIAELSEFYNVDNIFDEDIRISRKVQVASYNLSQWHNGLV
jgi:uncharacterized protein YifE (UPF0438 family)